MSVAEFIIILILLFPLSFNSALEFMYDADEQTVNVLKNEIKRECGK